MSHDLVLHVIGTAYVICNSLRLCAYVPQVTAVVRDRGGAEAISLPTWMFWAFSHAVTGVYCATVANDVLLAGMTWGNCAGACAVAALTAMKRRQVRVGPQFEGTSPDGPGSGTADVAFRAGHAAR